MQKNLTQEQIDHAKLSPKEKCFKFYDKKGKGREPTEEELFAWTKFLELQLAFEDKVPRDRWWYLGQQICGSELYVGVENGGRKTVKKAKELPEDEDTEYWYPPEGE